MKKGCAVILMFLCVDAFSYTVVSNQTAKLFPDDGPENAFGFFLATDGNMALIGASGNDSNGTDSGCAYLFDMTTREQIRKFVPTDGVGSDYAGFSVALSGNIALIGAGGDDDNGSFSGSAYLFDVKTGEQLHKLLPSDGAENDYFGESVAVSEHFALVGNDNYLRGVYLFDVASGEQLHRWPNIGVESFIRSKNSYAIQGNLALIGDVYDSENGSASGAAYVYDLTTYEQIRRLASDDGAAYDYFGNSVALDGNLALIGAAGDDSGTGSAYIFDISTGEQLHKLVPPADNETSLTGLFGKSVALRGGLALIGADHSRENGVRELGSAYVFDATTGERLYKLLAGDGVGDDRFGESSALIRGNALVGGDWNSAKGVYLFKLPAPDADIDGLPDWWEEQYSGGATNANSEATCSNGVNTCLEAYIAGLDPNDSESRFSISMNPDRVIQWQPSVSERVYSTYWTTNFLDGFVTLETNLPWTSGSYTDVIHSAESSGFYKVGVQLAP